MLNRALVRFSTIRASHRAALLLILLLAFAVRLAYWQHTASLGQYWLSMDDDEYYRGGQLFLHGQWLADPAPQRYTRGPGYPLLLAAGMLLAGTRIDVLLLLQVMVSVLTVPFVYLCARRAFGPRAGLIAAALMAIAPGYASFAASTLMSETLFVFFSVLFLYLFWRWTDQGLTWPRALGAGMVLGYAALIRPLAFEFFPLAALWLIWRERPRWRLALTRSVPVLAGMLLLVLPYTARNYIAYGHFSLIDTANGYTLWNNHLRPGQNIDILYTIENPVEREQYAYAQAFQNILADPVNQLLVRGGESFVYLWHSQLQSFAQGGGLLMDVLATPAEFGLVLLDDLYTIIIVLLALVGLTLYRRRAPSLLLLWTGYNILVILGTHAEARFRLPFLFVFVILAAGALASLPQLAHNWPWKMRFLAAAGAAVFLICAYSPRVAPLVASEYHLARAGGMDFSELQAAVDSFPTYVTAHDRLGDAYRRAGRYEAALAEYEQALRDNPEELQAKLGQLAIWQAQGAQAARIAARLDELPPDLPADVWFPFSPPPLARINVTDEWQGRAYALNLYPTERMGKQAFRWTAGRAFLKFPNGAQAHRLVLFGRANPLPGKDAPVPVTVLINGQSVGQVLVDSDWDEYELVLANPPRNNPDWIVELRPPVFCPQCIDPASTDDRELGIMLRYAELR